MKVWHFIPREQHIHTSSKLKQSIHTNLHTVIISGENKYINIHIIATSFCKNGKKNKYKNLTVENNYVGIARGQTVKLEKGGITHVQVCGSRKQSTFSLKIYTVKFCLKTRSSRGHVHESIKNHLKTVCLKTYLMTTLRHILTKSSRVSSVHDFAHLFFKH